jgi:hypothetical protein
MSYLTTNSTKVEEKDIDCRLQDDLHPGQVDWQSDLLWHLV